MAIPDFQMVMLPLLQVVADDHEHEFSDVVSELARHFHLTEEEQRELLPSGRYPRFRSRVGWARTDLIKAGLLEVPGRGKFRITERGRDVLQSNPDRLDRKILSRYPEFAEYVGRNGTTSATGEQSGFDGDTRAATTIINIGVFAEQQPTPYEVMETTYLSLRNLLADEILQQLKSCRPEFFEQIVVDVLVAMGYGGSRKDAGEAVTAALMARSKKTVWDWMSYIFKQSDGKVR